jgi:hypothetical protein
MTTLKDAKLKKMQEKVIQESHTKANLTPNKTVSKKALSEKRSVKVMSNIRPSEKAAFIALIGRKSESDVLRELVLNFIKNKEKA